MKTMLKIFLGIYWTQISCIAGKFFTSWATWEAIILQYKINQLKINLEKEWSTEELPHVEG